MSQIWKRFLLGKGGGSGGSPSRTGYVDNRAISQSPAQGAALDIGPEPLSSSPHPSTLTSSKFLSEADEQLFIGEIGVEDPLMVESQFVKTVTDIFSGHSTLPYFLQFLQGWGSDKYARFYMDVTSFKASAETHICSSDDELPHDKLVHGGLCNQSDKGCRILGKDDSEVHTTEDVNVVNRTQSDLPERTLIKSPKGEENAFSKGLVLPDLVSNIKTLSDVTPLNSPDGPSQIQHCDSTFLKETNSRESDNTLKLSCVVKDSALASKNRPVDLSVKDTPSDSNVVTLSRAQKLRQSIADDALRIFQKYISKEAEHSVGVDDSTREDICQKIHDTKQDIRPDCFDLAQEFVFRLLEKEYLPKFLASDYYLKHQIDVLTSGLVRLADILYSDSALPYFMEYVEQEGGRSMLQFWVAASNYRQQLLDDTPHDGSQAQSDAIVLYDKYFSLQATCPLGFSDMVRIDVEGNISREEGPSHLCFDLPLRVVLHVLERDFLPGYLSSNLHIKYLSELINTVKTSVELLGRKKRSGSESTCSSELSNSQGINSHNAAHSLDSSAPPRFRHLDDPDLAMRIDEAQITDPDNLWRRKNFSKMSCGFINELGRFESYLQPEPDRKTESKISSTVKKFLNMDENKVKEDMAYKVAEMIIKDVTNVTLGSLQSSARSSVGSSVPPLSPSSASQDNLSDVFSS